MFHTKLRNLKEELRVFTLVHANLHIRSIIKQKKIQTMERKFLRSVEGHILWDRIKNDTMKISLKSRAIK